MSDPNQDVRSIVDHLFRQESGRMVSILTRLFGIHNLELAEDVFQDSLHQALADWTEDGVPDNPGGWLMVVAKRKAINIVRRERYQRKFASDMDALLKSEWTAAYTMDHVWLEHEIRDSQLRMIFACCHPALPLEAQVALTLKTLCGFSIYEIASALLTSESNINKRLYRAREKIRNERIDFAVPSGQELLERLDAVLLVLYLLFNEGYHAAGDNPAIRQDLCLEAMRLGMLLTEGPGMNEHPGIHALLALMCLHAARFDARYDSQDGLILLEDQDRSLWDKELIGEGLRFLSLSATGDSATAWHLEAAIAAEHCLAKSFAETDWEKIYACYQALAMLKPTSVIRLNMAIISGTIRGPQAAITALHELEERRTLDGYYLLYASLGEFYARAGDKIKAKAYFARAKDMTKSAPTKVVLEKKIGLLAKDT